MKKLLLPLLCLAIAFTSCKKEKSIDSSDPGAPTSGGGNGGGNDGGNNGPDGGLEVKLNGQTITFTVESATLLRSTQTNQKRLDINGLSKDGTKKIILTFGEETAVGNGMSVKTYKVKLFNEDDPNTPEDESDDSMDGFMTYGTKLGTNSWLFDVYSENGTFTITACNESAKKVSGTFKTTLSQMDDPTKKLEFTEGKFTNVAYMVLN
ncbi:hypothetical protein [Paraflavitalea sp. CAU 1676]|uniref:hypothetical protein n=1 Tax=Paraflavitalea sp. CAU 1676 TaxID=3032598 RepID=UPI0023DBEE36|nr:hypothetical protein [Paraflavitalea sp. CAU 1676]MDF2193008.1 hypothetical protein [Paraflavitalea sp. CAU 1676]